MAKNGSSSSVTVNELFSLAVTAEALRAKIGLGLGHRSLGLGLETAESWSWISKS